MGPIPLLLVQMGYDSSAACECDAEEQTVDLIALQCTTHGHLHGLHHLTVLDDETIQCLTPALRSSAAQQLLQLTASP